MPRNQIYHLLGDHVCHLISCPSDYRCWVKQQSLVAFRKLLESPPKGYAWGKRRDGMGGAAAGLRIPGFGRSRGSSFMVLCVFRTSGCHSRVLGSEVFQKLGERGRGEAGGRFRWCNSPVWTRGREIRWVSVLPRVGAMRRNIGFPSAVDWWLFSLAPSWNLVALCGWCLAVTDGRDVTHTRKKGQAEGYGGLCGGD